MRLGRSDVLVAALVALWGQLDVWAPAVSHPYHMHGPRWANAVAFLAASLVLLWRRRAPLAVLVAVVLINGVHDVVVGSSESFPPLLALVVAAYTVAAWCDLRGALLGGGIAVAGLLVMEFTDPLFTHPVDVLADMPSNLFLIAGWLIGRYLRGRRSVTDRLQQEANRLAQEREARARAAVAEERARIARELHDIVAHTLGTMVLQAAAADARFDREPERARTALRTIEATGREALAEMRRLLGLLREADVEAGRSPQPGMGDINALVERVRAAGQPVELDVEGEPVALPPALGLAVYRVVQEALTNVVKHAAGAPARVRLGFRRDALAVSVTDTGRAAGGPDDGAGQGLVGMRERVSVFGGDLFTGRRPNGGFVVEARFPLSGVDT
jgi:signal transduction histidine kinase